MKIIFLTMEVCIVREITNTCEKISENYGRKYISMILCVAQTQSYEFRRNKRGYWIQSRGVEFKPDPDRAR